MRIRYGQLIGKAVRAADGTHLGRVADLIAEREGDALCVVALLVGPTSLMRRITFKRDAIFHLGPPRQIPWSAVARIAEAIHLRPMDDRVEGKSTSPHATAERAQ